jgi:hypothetical protein
MPSISDAPDDVWAFACVFSPKSRHAFVPCVPTIEDVHPEVEHLVKASSP